MYGSRSIAVAGSVSVTATNFAANDLFYLASGSQALQLPCSSGVSPQGAIHLFSANGTATINYTSGCTPTDSIYKNGSGGTSTTIAQGAYEAVIVTDGNGHYYVSGQ